MRALLFSLFALILSIVLLVAGNSFLLTLLSTRMALQAIEPVVIGRVLLFYSVGFVLGTLYAVKVIERVGHIRAFAVFSALLGITTLLYPVSDDLVVWTVLRFLGGFTAAGVMIIIESWFSAVASNQNRATLFGIYQICFYLASACGQLLLGLGNPAGFLPFSFSAMLLIGALIPLALTRMQAPVIEAVERLSLRSVFQIAPEGLLGALVAGMLLGAFYAVGPVYVIDLGLHIDQVAFFMAATIVCAMLLAWPLGRLCDRYDRRRITVYLLLLAALFGALALLLAQSMQLLTLFSGLYVGLVAALYPVAVAVTNDRMPAHHIVPASATLLLSYGAGAAMGPLASTLLMQVAGASGFYLFAILVLLAFAGYVRVRIARTRDIPVADQEAFVTNLPEGTAIINELDPRNEDFHETPVTELFPDLETEANESEDEVVSSESEDRVASSQANK